MAVRVLFFGATATATGKRSIELLWGTPSTAKEVFGQVVKEYPQLAAHKLLFSVNQNYSDGSELISDGDELAIFTAVSGG